MPAKADDPDLILYGKAVVPGLACGRPYLLTNEISEAKKLEIEHSSKTTSELNGHNGINSELEIEKLKSACTRLMERIQQQITRAKLRGRKEQADILNFHNTVLEDESLISEAEALILETGSTAAEAISRTYSKQIKRFEQIEDEKTRSKALDLYDILNSIRLLIYAGEDALVTSIPENSIIVADKLSPSQLIALPAENIAGIVCEQGDLVSHTAVLAAGLHIPAVFNCNGILDLCAAAQGPEEILVDGSRGQIKLNPAICRPEMSFASDIIGKEPAKTADGVRLELLANIVNIEEYNKAYEVNCDGTGLLRTETLFAGSSIEPDEELQYMRYRQAVLLASRIPGPVIFRTFDLTSPLGQANGRLAIVSERYCEPGDRGLARSLRNSDELRTQLRAIIRACADRECSILFPLVMSAADYSRAASLVQESLRQLEAEGHRLPSTLRIGAMIETPEAVAEADRLFELADFVSIGSNDLASYTEGGLFASENVEMIRRLTSSPEALSGQKGVIICGELAASPDFLPTWLKLGLRSFSINVMRMQEFKKTAAKLNSDGSITNRKD